MPAGPAATGLIAAALLSSALACTAETAAVPAAAPVATAFDLQGHAASPLDDTVELVLLAFVTPDCPISNRYAPELARIDATLPHERVHAFVVYPDPDVTVAAIEAHQREFALPWPALRDPDHVLVRAAQALVTPEVALWSRDAAGQRVLAYHGRIDDKFPEFGRARPQPRVRDLDDALTAVLAGKAPASATAPAVGCPIGDLR
ncbi:MAG: hypothetical protein K1X88_06145 [Nannocystaceae bacterium]|nr:hypothetical protein [Nannocystaceae bacterium]